jgi:hypothetical protein
MKSVRKNWRQRNLAVDKAAKRMAVWLLWVQNRFVRVMDKCFCNLPHRWKKASVFAFVLVGVCLSFYCIGEVFFVRERQDALERIGSFKIPRRFMERDVEATENIFVDENTWKRLQDFKIHMDSLRLHDPKEYEKRISQRPGLMDSIHTLEDIYYSLKLK